MGLESWSKSHCLTQPEITFFRWTKQLEAVSIYFLLQEASVSSRVKFGLISFWALKIHSPGLHLGWDYSPRIRNNSAAGKMESAGCNLRKQKTCTAKLKHNSWALWIHHTKRGHFKGNGCSKQKELVPVSCTHTLKTLPSITNDAVMIESADVQNGHLEELHTNATVPGWFVASKSTAHVEK